jgi:hypothetical protein
MYVVFVKLAGSSTCSNCKRSRRQIPQEAIDRLSRRRGGHGSFWCKHYDSYQEARDSANVWLRQLGAHFEDGLNGLDGFSDNEDEEFPHRPDNRGSREKFWEEDMFTVTIAKEAVE